MDVRIDQTGQQGFACALHHIGLESFGIGSRAFEDRGDLAVANQHRPVFNHLAVAREDARVSDQEDAGALQVAIKRRIVAQMFLTVRLPRAHQHERRQHRDHPQLIARPDLFFLLPPKELNGQEQPEDSGEQQGRHGRRVVP